MASASRSHTGFDGRPHDFPARVEGFATPARHQGLHEQEAASRLSAEVHALSLWKHVRGILHLDDRTSLRLVGASDDSGCGGRCVPIGVRRQRGYIGQVERGETRCRRDFSERVDKALKCEGKLVEAWDELLRGTKYPKYFVSFPKKEASAVQLRSYEAYFVYGLFQTEGYARATGVPCRGLTQGEGDTSDCPVRQLRRHQGLVPHSHSA